MMIYPNGTQFVLRFGIVQSAAAMRYRGYISILSHIINFLFKIGSLMALRWKDSKMTVRVRFLGSNRNPERRMGSSLCRSCAPIGNELTEMNNFLQIRK